MGPRAWLFSSSFLALYFVGWWVSGIPIQRGATGLAFFLGVLVFFFLGFFVSHVPTDSKEDEKQSQDGPPYLTEMTGGVPSDKAKMREAVLGGVLEAIKGLVVRSENNERDIKELRARVSELSLAAGLKPRVSRPGQEPKT